MKATSDLVELDEKDEEEPEIRLKSLVC